MGCTASYSITLSSRLAEEVSQLIGCSCSRPTLNHVASDCLQTRHHPFLCQLLKGPNKEKAKKQIFHACWSDLLVQVFVVA